MYNPDFGPRRGREFEEEAMSAIEQNSGWNTQTSPYDDYVRKIDFIATCPEGQELNIQFSLKQKSRKKLGKMARDNIVNITESDKQNIHDALCSACPLRAECDHHSGEESMV